MTETEVAVIGGGASGLMASIASALAGADTIILEHMDRVGKKILATGNGKCNYTNEVQGLSRRKPCFCCTGIQTVRSEKNSGVFS